MGRPTFSSIERNYQTSMTSIYSNTCAIRMSLALIQADPMIKNALRAKGRKMHGKFVIPGAQDLAAFLRNEWGVPDQSWAGSTGKPTGDGVICYMNIPTFSGQGHIGLWKNGASYDHDDYWAASPVWFWRLN